LDAAPLRTNIGTSPATALRESCSQVDVRLWISPGRRSTSVLKDHAPQALLWHDCFDKWEKLLLLKPHMALEHLAKAPKLVGLGCSIGKLGAQLRHHAVNEDMLK
jgi:hypothetical protein